jgi:hypothetical protein
MKTTIIKFISRDKDAKHILFYSKVYTISADDID